MVEMGRITYRSMFFSLRNEWYDLFLWYEFFAYMHVYHMTNVPHKYAAEKLLAKIWKISINEPFIN